MKTGNLLIQSLGEHIYLSSFVLVIVLLCPQLNLGKRLVRERARHDKRRVASGASQVKKTSLSEHNDSTAAAEHKSIHLGLDVDTRGNLLKSSQVNFVVKVTNVSNNSIVLHLGHGISHKNSLVTSRGDEDIGGANNIKKMAHSETFHACLESTDGIDLCHVDHTSVGTHGGGASLTNISVSADNSLLTSHHNISRTHETIRKRVLASIQVVEFRFGHTVIHIDGREEQAALLLHDVKTVHSSGSLLGHTLTATGDLVPLVGLSCLKNTLHDSENNLELLVVGGRRIRKSSILQEGILGLLTLVDQQCHVSTVVNDDVRSMTFAIISRPRKSLKCALPVLLKGLSLPGKNGSTLIAGDGSGGVVLRGEDVA
mmetsp:Transcript_29895/g.54975  ORF Transcript_29895/g.54975 Transcript_29895/m.54975 type:complete len:371 (+) Transcript_29895:182-1294(+)